MEEYQKFLKAAEVRRDEIRKLAETVPLREIAARYDLSVQRVYQIVGKRTIPQA